MAGLEEEGGEEGGREDVESYLYPQQEKDPWEGGKEGGREGGREGGEGQGWEGVEVPGIELCEGGRV